MNADQIRAEVDTEADALSERIDDIISMHEGDAREAIATLLMELEALSRSISAGYVRRRIPIVGKVTG